MSELWSLVLVAGLPALGSLLGGVLAELFGTSPRVLNLTLHVAAGVVLGVVSLEILGEAQGTLAPWWLALAFLLGGAAYVGLESLTRRLLGKRAKKQAGLWMVYVAVAVDLGSDGLLVGTGSTLSQGLARVLAAGQLLANIPGGYSTIAGFKDEGVSRGKRLLLMASFIVISLGMAGLAYAALRGASQTLQLAFLVFSGGVMTVGAMEDMMDEAHDARKDTRWSALGLVVGFAVFTIASAGLEEWLGGA